MPQDIDPGKVRILVVEDDKVMRTVLEQGLGATGYRVDTASGGAEAIRKLEEDRYDLVITDLVMPDEDGAAVLRAARRLDAWTSSVQPGRNAG